MKIGAVEKGVPMLEANKGAAAKKYKVDFAAMDIGDSFIVSVEDTKKLKGSISYLKILAKKQGYTLRYVIIDGFRARVWVSGEYVRKGGNKREQSKEKGENDDSK